jgi:hypothetical protein
MTMDRITHRTAAMLCAAAVLAVAAGGCAQKPSASAPATAPAAQVATVTAHSIPVSIREEVAAGKVPTVTVEAAIASLPGVKLPSGPLAASPDFALVNEGGSGVGVVGVAVYYASGVMVDAHPAPEDLKALQAECAKAGTTNPFVDGKRHDEMLSTPLGQMLAIEGGWQQGAPAVTPSRVIFAIDGIGYTIESTSAEPIPVAQLVALAGTMR